MILWSIDRISFAKIRQYDILSILCAGDYIIPIHQEFLHIRNVPLASHTHEFTSSVEQRLQLQQSTELDAIVMPIFKGKTAAQTVC